MKKGLVSIIIPSRAEVWLQKSIDSLLENATGDIEVIVALDGYWPKTPVKDDKRVIVVHHGELHNHFGMRDSINAGARIAQGEFIMKYDDHNGIGPGFDEILKADCDDNWIALPMLHKMDIADGKWTKRGDPIRFYMGFPPLFNQICERVWWHKKMPEGQHIEDEMLYGGSCYFMTRKHFDWLGGLDTATYGKRSYEARELCFKTWFGGGRVVRNNKTWFAHRSRQRGEGRGFQFSKEQEKEEAINKEKNRKYFLDYWMHHPKFKWYVEKFMPMPDWPEDWEEQLKNWRYE